MTSGERFVYYRGRKKRTGGRAPQVYVGAGVVGSVIPDPNQADRFVCEVLDYQQFLTPVRFRNVAGQYLEAGAARRGYFQRGVRKISELEFRRVLESAEEAIATEAPQAPSAIVPTATNSISYSSPAVTRAIDDFAVRTALVELGRRFPDSSVQPQPRNNPGFDVLVTSPRGMIFIEVKGTTRSSPEFFATEGELQFSRSHGDQFRLIVVYQIDLGHGTYAVAWHEGPISAETGFRLKPVQWACAVALVHDSRLDPRRCHV